MPGADADDSPSELWFSRGGEARLAEVIVGEHESFEAALKRFNKKVQADGILAEARRREHYEKPSVKRKKKEAARKRKARKAALAAQR
jgi:small subunit ribosomal protein S21